MNVFVVVYDSVGNLTYDMSKELKISYDWRGMPIEFMQESQPTGSSDNSLFRLTMAYDGSGRRISKTRWVKKVGSQEWEKELVTHYTGIGTEIRENYHNESLDKAKVVVNMPQGLGRYGIEDAEKPDFGGRTGDQLAGYIPNTKFEWFLKNHLGSTMLVYGTEGNATSDPFRVSAPLAAYDYSAFGEMVELTPPPTGKVTENFTGKEHDDEIALDYFGARYLDPMLGMWISMDNARQHFSPYTYGSNNPVMRIDPDGNADLRLALYYNATNNAGENVEFKDGYADALAASYQEQLSKQIDPSKDQISVKAFKEGDWQGMRDFLNGGDVRAIVTHGGKKANYITDFPNTKGETQGNHRIEYSLLQKVLKKTFVGACWAKENIDSKKMPNLIKPEEGGSIDVLKASTKYLLENSDTNKDYQQQNQK